MSSVKQVVIHLGQKEVYQMAVRLMLHTLCKYIMSISNCSVILYGSIHMRRPPFVPQFLSLGQGVL